jgi:hypothetical protein
MKRVLAAASLAALLVLAGCGSADEQGNAAAPDKEPTKAQEEPSASPSERVCQYSDGVGRRIGRADLDGDGKAEVVRLYPARGECPPAAMIDGTFLTASLPADEPPVTSAFAIAPSWADGQLLVTRSEHPRGGYQLRIFTLDGDDLTELTVDGQPLVPFVATDTSQPATTVACSDDGFVVGTGNDTTAYAVDGTRVTADGKAARTPAAQAPFADCRA